MAGPTEDQAPDQAPQVPLLRVVNPDATPEEVAALVAVFSALGSGAGEAPKRPRPSWNHPARGVRQTHRSGPGAWRASGLPR
jgi:hypothetical protein